MVETFGATAQPALQARQAVHKAWRNIKTRSLRKAIWRACVPLLARAALWSGPRSGAQRRAMVPARYLQRFARLAGIVTDKTDQRIAAHVMNDILCAFSRWERGFAINTRLHVSPSVLQALQGEQGTLIVTVHTHLGLALNAALHELGKPPVFVGQVPVKLADNSWGSRSLIEVIDSDDPRVLIRVRRALKSGRTVITFLDFNAPGTAQYYLSPNAFQLAESGRYTVLYGFTRLEAGGHIAIELMAEPGPDASALVRTERFRTFLARRSGRTYRIRRPRDLNRAES